MARKVLASGRIRFNLPIGANSQVLGTLYTVTAGKTAWVKEILITITNSLGSTEKHEVYLLSSGGTDLTTIAADQAVAFRAANELKAIIPITPLISTAQGQALGGLVVYARNTVMVAGDSLRVWSHYGAITPGNTDVLFQISGDES